MRTLRWVGIALLVAALAAAAWWGFSRTQQPEVSYRTAKIERGSLQAVVSASGTVTPVTQVQVSSQVSGQIKELFVDFNSLVKKGQLIARLDPETFDYRVRQSTADLEAARASVLTAQANVQSALAQVARAQVDVAETQRDEKRKLDLLAQNFISSAELDTAKAKAQSANESLKVTNAQVDVARAQALTAVAVVKQRDAQLQQARVDLERTQIRSPVDGIVIKRSVEVGQTVAASLQAPELFVIARNLDDMQVEAAIDEADISRVRDAQKVSFTIDAFPGRSFDGAVKQVRKAAVSAQNVVSYTVVVGFANPGSLMLPGMTANVRIITDTRDNVLKLPNAALRVRIAGIEPEAAASSAASASAPVRSGAAAGFGGLPTASAQGGWAASAPPAAAASANAGGGPSAGPLRELRQRLIDELGLSAAQQEQVDAAFAAQRPRFAELRNLGEAERPKARERIMADMRAQIAERLTPEQNARYQRLQLEMAGRQSTRGRIHLLGTDGKPRAYSVRLGISDGVMTELIVPPNSPEASVLVEGAAVITAVINTAATGAPRGAPTAPGPRPF
jgi:HlyD family secretion protein